MHSFHYPHARQDDVVENYHGTMVADPYRWLEDAEAEETQAFAAAQQTLARQYLDSIPARASYKARLTELWDHDNYSVPGRHGDRFYFFKQSGLQNQPVLHKQLTLAGEAIPVLDPNSLSHDGTVALTTLAFSKDGSLLVYGISASGSDWQELRIRNLDSGEEEEEVIKWCKFARIAWQQDNSGFFYNRHPKPGTVPAEEQIAHNQLYWHRLGTSQADDRLIYERPDNIDLKFPPMITEDDRYLILHVWHQAVARNRIYYRELYGESAFVRLIDEPDASYSYIGNDGPLWYLHTDLDAPRGRLVAIDLRAPERANWRDLIPEQEDTIAFAAMVNNKFVIAYIHDAYHRIAVYDPDGTYLHAIELPMMGSIVGFSGRRQHQELFIACQSFVCPTTLYRYDFTTGARDIWRQPEIDFDTSDYETRQVFFTSKDGTRVPMFLTHKKGLKLDGNNPTLMYGYGGYSISLTPAFGLPILPWLELGGVYAQVNLRGGNEYGDEWHRAGMLEQKQNVFDDFIAAAEWLTASDYTRSNKLGIMGRSNGGLLVGACMVQRPDLFGAVICGVGVLDMLRFHRFTSGRAWTAEYGNAETSPDHFAFLSDYSPYHQVKNGVVYPPILIHTGDTDDRVVPMHSLKFTARLQAASGENRSPILLRYDTKTGHGLGKPTAKVIDEYSDIYGFLLYTLEVGRREAP